MNRIPSLDDYDLQCVRPEEAALWGGDVLLAVEERADGDLMDGTPFTE
ncbi:hypothetical protein [Streptomyces fulvorobeus]|uniref:Uncharacterized protein n=1 Tax=Streptomyces fulvorobeus TaxID=284028 RepID=A0A7J0CE72_9ACTN|nr:hypothetical protein [Streptomyces fulvorobeus]NYE44250.1 hypothetical protein [Streptomyces fulvorobeus]GFN00766.1 hypothetical protein Sfulv_55760 [Streptomyces fulvorobeus]